MTVAPRLGDKAASIWSRQGPTRVGKAPAAEGREHSRARMACTRKRAAGAGAGKSAREQGQRARERRNPCENGAGGLDAEPSALGIFAQRCPQDTRSGLKMGKIEYLLDGFFFVSLFFFSQLTQNTKALGDALTGGSFEASTRRHLTSYSLRLEM